MVDYGWYTLFIKSDFSQVIKLKLCNNKYEIEISEDATYTLQSSDNKHYDYTFNPLKRNDLIKTFNIKILEISNQNLATNIALISSLYCSEERCAILISSSLIVLMNDLITQFDLESKSLTRFMDLGEHGCFFEIYKVDDGYIIYGELEILKLDFMFNIIWTFSGADIFVTQDDLPAFIITNDYIQLRDWNGILYRVDMTGKLIYDTYQK